MIDYAGLLATIGAPIFRAVTGWAQNAFEDGFIDNFEWRELASTLFRVGIPTAAIYFGIGSIPGVDMSAFAAASGGLLFDLIFFNRVNGKY